MAKPSIQSCPICNEALEDGYLSFLSYLKWCGTEPSRWHGLQGELVAGSNWWLWNRNTRALKCSKCDLLIFSSDFPKAKG